VSDTCDVLIVGGGIHGCAAAYFLARRGLRVIVLEKDRVGQHASGRSAGGVRQLGRDLAEVPISISAMELWYQLPGLIGSDGGFRQSAQVRVAETQADMAMLEQRAALVRSHGYDHEQLLDRKALFELLPALARHCIGGLVSHRDGFADPYKTTLAFAAKARELGAHIIERARVAGIERGTAVWTAATADGRKFSGAKLLNASGAWGSRLARALGDDLPLHFAAFMMSMTSPLPAFVAPVVIGSGRPISFKQMGNGQVMMGGGYSGYGDLDTGKVRTNVERLAYNVRTGLELFPILAQATIARSWCGLEGVLPDHIPVIGPSVAARDAYHAFGFCGHGFQLAPGVASLMAQLIADGRSNLPIEPFRADRFATKTATQTPAPG
jgi:sarcosine oxidase subunit beta